MDVDGILNGDKGDNGIGESNSVGANIVRELRLCSLPLSNQRSCLLRGSQCWILGFGEAPVSGYGTSLLY